MCLSIDLHVDHSFFECESEYLTVNELDEWQKLNEKKRKIACTNKN